MRAYECLINTERRRHYDTSVAQMYVSVQAQFAELQKVQQEAWNIPSVHSVYPKVLDPEILERHVSLTRLVQTLARLTRELQVIPSVPGQDLYAGWVTDAQKIQNGAEWARMRFAFLENRVEQDGKRVQTLERELKQERKRVRDLEKELFQQKNALVSEPRGTKLSERREIFGDSMAGYDRIDDLQYALNILNHELKHFREYTHLVDTSSEESPTIKVSRKVIRENHHVNVLASVRLTFVSRLQKESKPGRPLLMATIAKRRR